MAAGRRAPVRALMFDLFNTLVDEDRTRLPRVELEGRSVASTVGLLHAALDGRGDLALPELARVLREVDAGFVESHYAQGRELPTLERFSALAARLALADPALPERWTRAHMQAVKDAAVPVSHHPQLLAGLRRRFRTAVCSNFSHSPTALAVLDEAALSPHFDCIVISEEVGLRKPRAEIFQAVLDELDVAPEQTVHVGDNLGADVAGAEALGIRSVWITRCVRDPEATLRAYDGPPPSFVIRDLAELAGLLDPDA